MYKIFKDPSLQVSFEKEGYAKFNLLDEGTIEQLQALYNHYLTEKEQLQNSRYGMHISLNDRNLESKKKLIEKIQLTLTPCLNRVLENYKLHLGGFLTKMPEDGAYTYPHQDWTFVDNEDTKAFSATIWITLSPLSKKEGSLGFIKGSHRLFNEVIGSPSPATVTSAQKFGSLFFDYLEVPALNAGDALMFNNKTIHGAFPNHSDSPRIAIGVGVTPKHCSLYHYTLVPSKHDRFKKLKVDELFFTKYMNEELYELYQKKFDFKKYDTGEEVPAVVSELTEEEVESKIQALGNKRKITQVRKNESSSSSRKEDSRGFFEIYTPRNIYLEIKHRLGN